MSNLLNQRVRFIAQKMARLYLATNNRRDVVIGFDENGNVSASNFALDDNVKYVIKAQNSVLTQHACARKCTATDLHRATNAFVELLIERIFELADVLSTYFKQAA